MFGRTASGYDDADCDADVDDGGGGSVIFVLVVVGTGEGQPSAYSSFSEFDAKDVSSSGLSFVAKRIMNSLL